MRCTRCRGQDACLEIRRHNAAYCEPCFLGFFRDQITRAVDHERMFRRDESVLVAVSGGKDSLALWDALLELGYQAAGFYIGLGIPGYSEPSRAMCDRFAAARNLPLIVVDLQDEYGLGISETVQRTARPACSACGLSKRYLFNKVAADNGFRVIATGHNLDDEAATLFGNVLRWQTGYLGRQAPVLPEDDGLVKKVKPLYRLAERETAAYAVLRGIDYIVEECPNSVGAKSLFYKDVLNQLEAASPGTKQAFLTGFLDKARPLFQAAEDVELRECERCGQPTTTPVCAFCRLREEVTRPRPPRRGRGRSRSHPARPPIPVGTGANGVGVPLPIADGGRAYPPPLLLPEGNGGAGVEMALPIADVGRTDPARPPPLAGDEGLGVPPPTGEGVPIVWGVPSHGHATAASQATTPPSLEGKGAGGCRPPPEP